VTQLCVLGQNFSEARWPVIQSTVTILNLYRFHSLSNGGHTKCLLVYNDSYVTEYSWKDINLLVGRSLVLFHCEAKYNYTPPKRANFMATYSTPHMCKQSLLSLAPSFVFYRHKR
jgi:hypothetical protein